MKETWTYSVHENSRIACNDLGAIAMDRCLTIVQNFSPFTQALTLKLTQTNPRSQIGRQYRFDLCCDCWLRFASGIGL